MSKKNIHVTPRPEGWAVKIEGNEKASKVLDTQKQAIHYGKEIAKSNASELIIHGTDGKIRQKDSYGNDPKNRKG